MKPSEQQAAIYKAVLETDSNIQVRATAGSGKTTTLIEAAKLIPTYKKTIFLAFNKDIAQELKLRAPSHIEVSTIHSLGMRALMAHYRTHFKVTEFKSLNFMKKVIEELEIKVDEKQRMAYQFGVSDIINMARMTDCNIDSDNLTDLAFRNGFSVENGAIDVVIGTMKELDKYNAKNHKPHQIDFTDMITLPLKLKVRLPVYDFVQVDECQDLNAAQRNFVEKLIKPKTGRLFTVGDPRQAIYSFMGADIDSFNRIAARPNTVQLPLSVSYRLPKTGVELAQSVYPEIQPYSEAIEGIQRNGSYTEIKEGDFVLCRNNAPLVKLYFELIAQEIKCSILGKDIEKNLLNLLSEIKHLEKPLGLAKLKEKLVFLENKLEERGVKKPKEHVNYLALAEKIFVITLIAEKYRYLHEVEAALHRMFSDTEGGVKLSSIHKSKGLEFDRVFMIGRELIPSKYATSKEELEAEQNLLFVAYTRHKKEFIFANDFDCKL